MVCLVLRNMATVRCNASIEKAEGSSGADGFGQSSLILAGENLLALSDIGELAVVEASPSRYRELGRKRCLAGNVGSTPILADGLVLARSTEEAACLSVR